MDKLRRYQISIDPSLSDGKKLGIDMVAYTDNPAILVKGLAFDGVKKLKFTDSLRGRVAAPVLIPDIAIPREDESGYYEVVFSKEVIELLYEDFMLNRNKDIFNLDHKAKQLAPSFILESWITVEPEKDKSFTKYGVKVPEGSLFFVSQFTDMEYFKKEIIEKDRAAYSIEGFLGMELKSIKNKIQNMSKQKFVSATTKSGVVVSTEAEAFAVGVEVYTENESGEKGSVPDGEHELENGNVITVEGNKITAMTEATEEVDEEMAEVIQKAVEPVTSALSAQIKELTEKLTALEVKFSNQPGQPVKKEIAKPVELSKIERVKILLNKKQK
jgi:hypothetical protein